MFSSSPRDPGAARARAGPLVDLPPPSAVLLPFGVALLVIAAVHGSVILSRRPLLDEVYYLVSLHAFERGRDMNTVVGWYYSTPLLHLWRAVDAAFGEHALLVGQRTLNAIGAALVASACAAMAGRRWAPAVAAAAVLLPNFWTTMRFGNVSGLLTGLIVAAGVSRGIGRPILLAVGFLFKPYALALSASRPWREGLLALGCALAVWFDARGRSLLNIDGDSNSAPIRALHELGIPLPWQVLTVAGVLAAATLSRRSWFRGMCFSWLSLPIAWNHAALLLLPPLAAAFRTTLELPRTPRRTLALLAATASGLVVVQIQFFGLRASSRLMSGLVGLVPTAAALTIAWLCPGAGWAPAGEDAGPAGSGGASASPETVPGPPGALPS